MKIALIIVGIIVLYFIVTAIIFSRKLKNVKPGLPHESIIILTDTNFSEVVNNGVSLVDFWADWCMPCKMQGPIIDEVAKEIGTKAQICKLDVQVNQSAAQNNNVKNIPTMILFKNGVEIQRFVGIKSKQALVKAIENILV